MTKYLLSAAAWVALSYPVYRFLGPVAVCLYGLASMIGLLVWAATRKPTSLNDKADKA